MYLKCYYDSRRQATVLELGKDLHVHEEFVIPDQYGFLFESEIEYFLSQMGVIQAQYMLGSDKPYGVIHAKRIEPADTELLVKMDNKFRCYQQDQIAAAALRGIKLEADTWRREVYRERDKGGYSPRVTHREWTAEEAREAIYSKPNEGDLYIDDGRGGIQAIIETSQRSIGRNSGGANTTWKVRTTNGNEFSSGYLLLHARQMDDSRCGVPKTK